MTKNRILVVDDEPGVRFGIRHFLERSGFHVDEAVSCASARESFRSSRPAAAILDYRLPDGTALELLPRIKSLYPEVPVIILTGHGSIELAVSAIKLGAENFLTKPLKLRSLLALLERLIEAGERRGAGAGEPEDGPAPAPDPFVGDSPAIRALEATARKLLAADTTLLVSGETGSGKGVLARWLHANGPRAGKPFVDLNCAGLSPELLESELFGYRRGAFTGASSDKPGLFEAADGGSLFLDEIGDLDLGVQPKLLMALEERRFRRLGDVRDRRVDVRLIAATHHDLASRVQQGRFRSDLYFRINTLHLRMPALRERREDVPLLARHLLARICAALDRARVELSEAAAQALAVHPWPGNIRQLRNVLERSVLLSGGEHLLPEDLLFSDLPAADLSREEDGLTLQEMERLHIRRALEREGGNVARAAVRLGVPLSSLYQKIRKHRIPRPNPRRPAGGRSPDRKR